LLRSKWDEALADYNRALELRPRLTEALAQRGAIKQHKGQNLAAMRDYDQALEINPGMAQIYLSKGQAHSTLHQWAEALKDFRKYCEKSTGQVDYAEINIWMCRSRQNDGEAASEELTTYFKSHPGTWAARVAECLAGKLTREALIKEAQATSDDTKKMQQLCEAYYYAGVKKLLGGDTESAREDFKRCVSTEVEDFVEYDYAQEELKRMINNGSSQ
jgi:lipoprotein NlpI